LEYIYGVDRTSTPFKKIYKNKLIPMGISGKNCNKDIFVLDRKVKKDYTDKLVYKID